MEKHLYNLSFYVSVYMCTLDFLKIDTHRKIDQMFEENRDIIDNLFYFNTCGIMLVRRNTPFILLNNAT